MQKKRMDLDRCRYNSGYFAGKRAQITVFIILGILLLLALVLVVLLQKEVIVFKPEELIPTEKGKVESYITSCIDKIGDDALFSIGLHGGYIEVPEELFKDSSQHLKLSPNEVVPYWARGESTRIPSLESIKEDIDNYVEENLRKCLLGTEVFTENYDIIEKSAIEADTEIVDKKVIFNVRWDLEVRDKAGEVITELIDHVAESPIKLKRTYETAKSLIEREMDELRFERLTRDLISLENPKVPLSGIEISCGKKKWKVEEAKETLKDMLRVNVKKLKVEGTDYAEFPESLPYYQNHYIWDIGVNYPEIGVNFNYDNNFPFYFEVTPREGNIMKSGVVGGNSDLLSYVCVQMWKFTYDVVYPVLVEVRDETTGYVFHTAFTVHVKRNKGDRSGEVLTPSAMTIDMPDSEEYCKKREVPITVYTNELVENNETGVYWTDPLEGVNLSYTCLKYKCDVGQTEYGFGGRLGVAAYKTNFPYCTGGILRGEKEGYEENWVRVAANKEQEVNLNLIPLFKFLGKNIKVMKHDFESLEGAERGEISAGRPIESGDTVSIKITRDKEGRGPYESSIIVSPDLDEAVLKESYLEFLGETDFKYNLEIYLMGEEGVKGGYEGNWTVDWNKLKSGKEIVFHVLSKDNFKDETELFDFMANLDKYSLNNTGVLSPEIK